MKSDKMTMKEVKRMYENIISVGYCELCHMLQYTDRIGHTEGVYGWNANIYQLDQNTCICTGYRPFGNIDVNYGITKKYNEEARQLNAKNMKYEEIKEKLEELKEAFKNEALKIEE